MERIIEISKKLGHSHIGSSLTAYPIIKEIFGLKNPDEKFVLSNGHAALALYCVMFPDDTDAKVIKDNIHADSSWCDASTGSLGHGLGIAVGMALADRSKDVYCMISDGECAEGSIWEALRIAHEQRLYNLKVYVNANGFASYQSVDLDILELRLKTFFPVEFRRTKQEEPYTGLNGHYLK
jgi:transketolase